MYRYELYVPDRYLDNGFVKFFDDFENIIDNIAYTLITRFNLTGLSVRDEKGYYVLKSGSISKMNNKVIYFFSENDCKVDFIEYCSDLKLQLRQESLLIICNGEEILC